MQGIEPVQAVWDGGEGTWSLSLSSSPGGGADVLWAAPEDRTGPGWRKEICLLHDCVMGSQSGGELPILGGMEAEAQSLGLQILRKASRK